MPSRSRRDRKTYGDLSPAGVGRMTRAGRTYTVSYKARANGVRYTTFPTTKTEAQVDRRRLLGLDDPKGIRFNSTAMSAKVVNVRPNRRTGGFRRRRPRRG